MNKPTSTNVRSATRKPKQYKRLHPEDFVDAAEALVESGWHPVPIGGASGKQPLVGGVSGYAGIDVDDPDEFKAWATRFCDRKHGLNLGTRAPLGTIGIDGDFYDGKPGRQTLADAEDRWGPLPKTWMTTARDDGSGIRWFRIPEECADSSQWRALGELSGGGAEIVQRHHRVGALPPSIHHTGSQYRVIDPDGNECDALPPPDTLPMLPTAWIAGLACDGRTRAERGTPEQGQAVLDALPLGAMEDSVGEIFVKCRNEFTRVGSRHQAMNTCVVQLVKLGKMGWPGVPDALRILRNEYVRAVANVRGSEATAHREFTASVTDGSMMAATINCGAEIYGAFQPGGTWHKDTPYRGRNRKQARELGLIDEEGNAVQKPRFCRVSAKELARPVPPMKWLVQGVWPRNSFGPAGGEKKTLKTYNLLSMGVAVASGEPMFGEFEVASPGPVLYYVGEGGLEPFQRRLQAIARAYGVDLADLPIDAVFDLGSLSEQEFVDALHRNLDELQPELVIIDPLYAYHPPGIEAQNLYERGRMLAELSAAVAGEAALVVADHFKKSGHELDLDSIGQSGMAQWADSWMLQRHRKPPDLATGEFQLDVEFGSRQWGGSRWHIDWTIPTVEAEAADLDWSVRRAESAGEKAACADRVEGRVFAALRGRPFEMTRSKLAEAVGGNRRATLRVIDNLLSSGHIEERRVEQKEGVRMVPRDRLGLVDGPQKYKFEGKG
ncbi:AAA family ATPase [Rhodococcus sp. USK10]|uniref:AAA family ATPase n=1 Tax=Rhodococcus sp. USK10 TaxID=2789739 RepID=UPI001C5E529A|nr:AAA family ATPase [Rhodococcus sp. USK10]QYB02734.1 AAA family ATPase [Rhodococcus sp. USK10]